MIAYLEGQILRSDDNLIVLQTTGGVGYAVHVTQHFAANTSPDELITLHIYTNVREDDISLYGFHKLEEKELFEMLIKTSGVGPKLGLAVLSVLSPTQLVDAIHQSSVESFSQVPGIGKKTAAKLCLDLKDQLKRHPISGFELGMEGASTTGTASTGVEIDGVFSALKNLGYSEKEILAVLRKTGSTDLTFEVRLKKALSLLTPLR
ncbi:MAG: Holliday junction branch migration protein RuvA [SAR324 cluster bacterium]|nr:Holliday junction branch migration protein RuvA [SAR324 cluster bacterium]MBL7034223.1 Holliday junction branch migration protein RuvA [SAR324 cluster bacterium]